MDDKVLVGLVMGFVLLLVFVGLLVFNPFNSIYLLLMVLDQITKQVTILPLLTILMFFL
ncbi:MAG: hypothetical protein KO318_07275 [Methanobacterium sp.]|nr:hypothetical protein [Methanobacterium sp.]